MKYGMTRPCGDCPFLKVGGIRLSQKRVREIAGAMLDSQGATFQCHATVDYDLVDEHRVASARETKQANTAQGR